MDTKQAAHELENIKDFYSRFIKQKAEEHGGISVLSEKLKHAHNYLTVALKHNSITGLYNAVKQIEKLESVEEANAQKNIKKN